MEEEVEKCESCGENAAREPHACPYAEELNNSDKKCNCCENCTYSCLQDI